MQVGIPTDNLYFFIKDAGHEMAIVGGPCNVDAHAKIHALFISMLSHMLRSGSSTKNQKEKQKQHVNY